MVFWQFSMDLVMDIILKAFILDSNGNVIKAERTKSCIAWEIAL